MGLPMYLTWGPMVLGHDAIPKEIAGGINRAVLHRHLVL